jgi:filamentous hemagglutinin
LKGADITVKAGDTLTNYAAQIDGTGTVLQIAGNSALNYTATQSRSAKDDTKSSTSFMGMAEVGHDNSTTTSINSQELGTKIFGKEIGIKAKDVVIKGAEVVAKELVQIDATDSVTITAATNTSSTRHTEDKSMMGISANIGSGVSLNSSASTLNATQSATTSSASTISGANVTIKSGGDTTIQASNVIADKDVSVTAGGNINILAAKNTETSASQSTSSATSIGLVGGVSPRQTLFSNTNTAGNGQGTSTTSTTSVLSANGGNLTLAAKNGTVTVQGAELLAQDKVSITAQDVDLQAITDRSTSSNHFESHSITVGAALSGTVGSKITAISDNLQLASNTSNERLKGAATLKAGYDAYKLVSGGAAEGIASQSTTKDGDPSGSAFGVSVSVGINSSKQDNSSAASQSRGTSIQAKDIDITATGGPGSTAGGNITAVGAKLQGENISLDAAKDINLMAAVNTNNLKSSNESHSLGGGVTFGVGQQNGFSFQFNAGQANGNTDGVELGYDNTLVTATKNLSVKSGGNTNLVGAQLAGDKVKMNVGGDLNIVTLQDTSKFDSEQHSSGIAVSLCIPPLCVGNVASGSINKSDSTIAHNYQSATGQSGIAAGSGGYDITVKGNTDLVGGAITSTAAKDKNTLSTGSLTSSDLNNTQNTNSQSSSISLSYSGSSSAMGNLANNVSANLLGNLGAGAGLPANGSQSGVTQSVISPGNVTITGTGDITKDENSNIQVATLTGRDASKANGALTNTLTLQQAQLIPGQIKEAQENAQAAQLVAPVINNLIGDLGAEKGWPPGSPQMVLLHGMAGVVQASISGTSLVSGATVGAVNEYVTPIVADYLNSNGVPTFLKDKNGKDVLDSNGKPVVNPEFADLLKAGSVILGATVGGAVGGNATTAAAGGNIALSGTADNYLDHVRRKIPALSEKERYDAALAACGPSNRAACDTRDELYAKSKERDAALAKACDGSNSIQCNLFAKDAAAKGNVVTTLPGGFTFANSPTPSSLNTTLIGPPTDLLAGTPQGEVASGLVTAAIVTAPISSVGLVVSTGIGSFNATTNFGEGNLVDGVLNTGGVLLNFVVAGAVKIPGNSVSAEINALISSDLKPVTQMEGLTPVGANGGVVNLAETQATLTTQVADLRATLPSGPKSGGNMGVAQIDIPGIQPTMAASSKVDAPTAAQTANGFVGLVPETFPSTVVPTGGTSPVQLLRSVDSEAKILNNVAAKLGDNTAATGTINLLTERSPCASCSNVIDLFRAKYPNITLNVFDNNGKLIPPTKKGP